MNHITETTSKIYSNSKVKTMSSREIAKLTGKEHKNVLRDIEIMLAKFEISQLTFEP